jgi:uncharacterized protein (TIGR03067 family)
MNRCQLAALLVLPLLGSDEPRFSDGATSLDPLTGKWLLVSLDFNGQPFPNVDGRALTFQAGRYADTGWGHAAEGDYKVVGGQGPEHLELMPTNGPANKGALRCLFRVEGDTLWTAHLAGVDRPFPGSFRDSGLIVIVWERVKR